MKKWIVLGICLVAVPAAAQQPLNINTRVVTRSAGGDVQQTFNALLRDQVDAAWVGYTIPVATDGDGALRNDGWSERCRLEPTTTAIASNVGTSGPVRLEPSKTVMVLFRLQNHEVQRIRTFSSDCQIDAGGLTLTWLDAVVPSQSVALLKTLAADTTRSEAALSAIALHQDPSATAVLLDVANNGIPKMRERALFWIAKRAEAKAAVTITGAIEHDPDAEVKKQAVFALSQLPRGEGVPLLINLARTNTNPIVRKQAYFWLGQSKDPRALTFFEQILR